MNRTFFIPLALALFWTHIIFPGLSQAATFTVDSTLDEVDADIGDCVCLTASNTCALRAAVQEANACAGDDTINLSSGNYVLTLGGAGEDGAATGDLDITDNLIILGDTRSNTIIDANSIDRVFQITGSITVSFQKVTIQKGVANLFDPMGYGRGGGIYNEGNLSLTNVAILDNIGNGVAANFRGQGGGIYNAGTLSLLDCLVERNHSSLGDGGGSGGGLYNIGTTTINTSIIKRNVSENGGGIFNVIDTSRLTVRNSTLEQNSAGIGTGGGINNSGILDIENSLILGKGTVSSADAGAGILNTGQATLKNVTISQNRTLGWGGGISNGNGISGMCPQGASMSLLNVTIDENSSNHLGDGIYNVNDCSLFIKNTIVANSISGGNCSGVMTSQGHNLDSGNTVDYLFILRGINRNKMTEKGNKAGGITKRVSKEQVFFIRTN